MITTQEARAAVQQMDMGTLLAFIDEVERNRQEYRWYAVGEKLPPATERCCCTLTGAQSFGAITTMYIGAGEAPRPLL